MSGNEIFKKMYSVSSGANFFFVFNFSFINQGVPTSFSSTIQDGTTIYHRQLFFLRANTGTMIFFSFPNWTLVQLFSFLFCTFLNTIGKNEAEVSRENKISQVCDILVGMLNGLLMKIGDMRRSFYPTGKEKKNNN